MNEEFCRTLRPLLAAVVIILIIAAMRLTAVVTMPVALALFIVIIAWPLQTLLERKRLPRALCYIITLFAILLAFGFFIGIIYICAESVAAKAPEYEERFSRFYDRLRIWAEDQNMNGNDQNGQFAGRVMELLQAAVKWLYGLLGLFAVTVTFVVLGLIEVHSFRQKVEKYLSRRTSARLLQAGEEVSMTLQRYMLARTIVSGSTGILVGLFTWAIGLDFALVWGVMAFLLNYIPILGSIVAVIPPTVIAFIQPEGLWMGFATLGGLVLIQFTIGNYIDPQIEGKILSLSPVVLFFSIMFWGWVWSIPGALMGIPITATIVIFCRKFENTEWLANMLAREKPS